MKQIIEKEKSVFGLLIGCWDVGGAFKRVDRWKKLEGAEFKQTKWLEDSCIHRDWYKIQTFWLNVEMSKIMENAQMN